MKNDEIPELRIPRFRKGGLVSAEIHVDTDLNVAQKALDIENRSSLIGKMIALIFFIGGVVLIILGITGNMNVDIGSTLINAKIVNCTPGVFLLLLSVFIIWITNPKIKIKK